MIFRAHNHNKSKFIGFTLIELLVVMGVISILMAVAVPSYGLIREKTLLNSEAQGLVSILRVAQNHAISSQNGNAWGVRLEANRYIIFSGSWAAPQNTIIYRLENGLEIIQGVNTEVVFSRLSGTSTEKTISLGFDGDHEKIITIQANGKISN